MLWTKYRLLMTKNISEYMILTPHSAHIEVIGLTKLPPDNSSISEVGNCMLQQNIPKA